MQTAEFQVTTPAAALCQLTVSGPSVRFIAGGAA